MSEPVKYFDALPTWHPSRDWVMADQPTIERHRAVMGDKPPDRWLDWKAMPPEDVCASVKSLRLRAEEQDPPSHLPDALSAFSSLVYLSLPCRFAKTLTSDQIPSSVQVLSFDEDEGRSATLSRKVSFPSVQEIRAVSNVVTFRRENLPNLRRVNLKLRPRGKMVEELCRYSSFEWVHLGALHHQGTISDLVPLQPVYLGLFSCRYDSLAGIEKIPSLRFLWLHSLGQLEDIGQLARCGRLEDVQILYCDRLRDLRPLTAVPQLKSLSLVECRSIDLEGVRDELHRRIERVSITGKVR